MSYTLDSGKADANPGGSRGRFIQAVKGVAAPNGTYSLTVQASNASGVGAESPAVGITVAQAATPPGAPTGLAVAVAGSTSGPSNEVQRELLEVGTARFTRGL